VKGRAAGSIGSAFGNVRRRSSLPAGSSEANLERNAPLALCVAGDKLKASMWWSATMSTHVASTEAGRHCRAIKWKFFQECINS
jgi:hypothetical protein